MISREQFDAYNRAVANLSDGAQREIESRIMSWLETDEGRSASIAECREYAKSVMSGVVQVYDSAAASLAAEWYDKQAADSGVRLPAAVTATTYNPESVDETARYQAKKLAKGDPRGFAEYCGELGRNDVLRSLNETIMRNAARDRKKGVRFARVPTGAETCTYCLMLASRGAVYHSRKTAGEFRHFHRRCDCKVVPGFEDAPDTELVEGVRPKELRELWGKFREIDDSADLSAAEKLAAKRGVLSVPGPPVVYEKPKDALLLERGGAYDLAVHAALRAAGHEVVVREEDAPEGFSNIDLVLDGRLCELKSPTTEASGTNGLRFIERNIRKAIKQFQKVEGGPVKPSIVVINCMEVPVARDDALKRVHLEMSRHDIDRVILLSLGGAVDDVKK